MKYFSSKMILLFFAACCLSCAERENENLISQYEDDLEKNVSDYEFVDFEWYNTYTVKDSLETKIQEAMAARDEAGQEATRYLDRNEYESRDYKRKGNLDRAEIQLNLMKDLDTLATELQAKYDEISEDEDRIIRQKAIHTFRAEKNGGEEVYKVLVTFDGDGNYIEKGIAVDALQFENILEMGKNFSELKTE